MQTYQVASTNCQLQVYARGNRQRHTAILFLHGGPGSGAQPLMDVPVFQTFEKEYLCVYFDQRGCGKSLYDIKQGLLIEDIKQDVAVVIEDTRDRYHITNVLLWGGSFGGCLACLYAETYGDRIQGLILSSPAITFNRSQALAFYERMKAPYSQRVQGIEEVSAKDTTPEQFFADAQVQAFIYSEHNPLTSLKHICAMSSWFYMRGFGRLFTTITTPTLVMQGKEDPICNYQYIDEEIKAVHNPHIQYQLYEACGHAVFEDKEKEFVDTMMKFIGGIRLC